MGQWALPVLALGVALILISTAQWPHARRAIAWTGGAACLALASCWVLTDSAHFSLLSFLTDGVRNWQTSVLSQAVQTDWPTFAGALTPLFDLLLLPSALAALVALVAFLPGERLERALRPVLLVLLGATGGGLLVVAVMVSGLGGYEKNRAYAGFVKPEDVLDGDTFKIGEVSLRLWGIDAPEYRVGGRSPQTCDGPRRTPCGQIAREALVSLIDSGLVYCRAPNHQTDTDITETFGRPLVQCWVHRDGKEPRDIAQIMARDGYADVSRTNGRRATGYCDNVRAARREAKGIWQTSVLAPHLWRTDSDARREFQSSGARALTERDFVDCRWRSARPSRSRPSRHRTGS